MANAASLSSEEFVSHRRRGVRSEAKLFSRLGRVLSRFWFTLLKANDGGLIQNLVRMTSTRLLREDFEIMLPINQVGARISARPREHPLNSSSAEILSYPFETVLVIVSCG